MLGELQTWAATDPMRPVENNLIKNDRTVWLSVCLCASVGVLTFADTGSVHHPDKGGAILAVGGYAVLGGLEDVAIVLFYLQGAENMLYVLYLTRTFLWTFNSLVSLFILIK